ncbi:thioesterase family protein [Apiospora saccharicola]
MSPSLDLKLDAATSTLRLELSQKGKLRVAAQATATNFDELAGPTVPSAWAFHPPPAPVPDFAKILAHQPDEHWLPADCVPSLSDTLVNNHGLYDARRNFEKIQAAARENPGKPAVLTNSYRELAASSVFNNTVTLDIEFKRRLREEGVQWTFTRAATRMLEAGRMDLDITICNEKMEYLCLARQVVLALDVSRSRESKGGAKSKAAL